MTNQHKILTVDDIIIEDYHLLFPSMIRKLGEKEPEEVFAYASKLKETLSYDQDKPKQFADSVMDYIKSLKEENEKKKELLAKICYDFKVEGRLSYEVKKTNLKEYSKFLNLRADVETEDAKCGYTTVLNSIYKFKFNGKTEKKYHDLDEKNLKNSQESVKSLSKLNGNDAFDWLKSVYDRSVELSKQKAGKIRWIVEDSESPVRELFKKSAVPCCLTCSYDDNSFGYLYFRSKK